MWFPPLFVARLIYKLFTDIGSYSATSTYVFRVLSFFWTSVTHGSPASQRLIGTVVRKAAHVVVFTLFSTILIGSFYIFNHEE